MTSYYSTSEPYIDTFDALEIPNNHLGMVLKRCKLCGYLSTSTGDRRISAIKTLDRQRDSY